MISNEDETPSASFYSLSQEERVSLVRHAFSERRSLFERWRSLAPSEPDPWTERAARAADMLVGHSSVADLGCGNMQLEKLLPADCRYVPIDIIARDSRTIVADFNSGPVPRDLNVTAYALLGLVEYIYDVPNLPGQLEGTLVVSCNPVDLSERSRIADGWLNTFSAAEFERIASDAGWSSLGVTQIGPQLLWQMQRNS